jgi:hypothetical protein
MAVAVMASPRTAQRLRVTLEVLLEQVVDCDELVDRLYALGARFGKTVTVRPAPLWEVADGLVAWLVEGGVR